MASESIALPFVDQPTRPISDRLHDWVITVDHKKLGILYILLALLFLAVGGIEATIIRLQLIVPHSHFVSPGVFNSNDLFCCNAHGVWLRYVSHPVDDWCSRHGLPAVERPQFLAQCFWWVAFVF